MESTWVDTSLGFDLNANPLSWRDHHEAKVKKEMQSDFTDMGLINNISTEQQAAGVLVEKINQVNAENKKLSEMLTAMCESYNSLQNRLMLLMNHKNPDHKGPTSSSKKRKAESSIDDHSNSINGIHGNTENSYSDEDTYNNKKQTEDPNTKTSVVYVQSDPSDTRLIVKDGYQWRKYGQKVTRDNPSPRAYFKCSFAPSCPVKKKVQRSVKDQSVLVATYEGEHNHPRPCEAEEASGANRGAAMGSAPAAASSSPIRSSGSTITLDLTQPGLFGTDARKPKPVTDNKKPVVLQQFLVEQMASSLSKDPSFTAALAAAISGNFFQHCTPAQE